MVSVEDLNWPLALPEILLSGAACLLLMLGVFHKGNATRLVGWLTIAVLFVAMLLIGGETGAPATAFADGFIVDDFGRYTKVLILGAGIISLLLSLSWLRREEMERFEFPVLILFALIGMMIMASSNDLMMMFVGLELASLAQYIVAAYHRDSLRSTEAGLKYFVLGAVSTGVLLFGISLVYGFSGGTGFLTIAKAVEAQPTLGVGMTIGLVFIIAGLAFKVSAAPFHMWTPDVYEGAPTPVTAFFASAPKIAGMALFLRLLAGPFEAALAQWQQVIIAIAVLSMFVGAFAAIGQSNIKRLLAYSSIGHIGYALIGLAAGSLEGVRGVLVYLGIYLFMTLGTFAIVMAMRRRGRLVEGISDLAGLSRTHPALALAMAVLMFSMAGIPPLAGFFGKFYVFVAAVNAQLYTLAVIGVLTSVVAAYYYLRIIKVMYFDDATDAIDMPVPRASGAVALVGSLAMVVFILAPSSVILGAEAAASALIAPAPPPMAAPVDIPPATPVVPAGER